VLLAAVGLAGRFVVGYLSRELAFWITGRVEIFAQWCAGKRPGQAASNWSRVRYLLGSESTAAFAELHPMLEHLDADGAARPAVPLTSGGGHQADASLEVFNYGKLWLRSHADSLNIDFIEIEINVLASTLVPVMLFAADLLALGDEPVAVQTAALPVALVIWIAILK
jgi:hypothetical protein